MRFSGVIYSGMIYIGKLTYRHISERVAATCKVRVITMLMI